MLVILNHVRNDQQNNKLNTTNFRLFRFGRWTTEIIHKKNIRFI